MDFNDFINSESDRVGKPKQKKKKVENKLPSSIPIEERQKKLEELRKKSLYIDLRRKRND
ncbi:hypothetical protein Biyabedamokiny2_00189 [Staphylococcus phage Biyabeda-mokiny_2]|nr:hypothetical protein Biyabedamokiny2_00189 [Staphylococcus phage Biyabeda-mokiny_2]WJJ56971.1 hypothetical protein vBSAP01_181 [Staphylococcus phage vB_SAP01]